jgi:hypothetical protein
MAELLNRSGDEDLEALYGYDQDMGFGNGCRGVVLWYSDVNYEVAMSPKQRK